MSLYPPIYGTRIGPYSNAITAVNSTTIVIVNADITQSLTDATTYCSLRNIPTANIRQVHFGTTENLCYQPGLLSASTLGYCNTSGTPIGSQFITTAAAYNGVASGSALFTMIANEIQNYGALCVLFSTYTPTRVYQSTYYLALPAMAGNAWGVINATGTNGNSLTFATTLVKLNANLMPANWASSSLNTAYQRPHGRIGVPDLTAAGSAFAELTRKDGNNLITTTVGNALIREAQNNAALGHFYSSAEENSFLTGSPTAYAAYLSQLGATNKTDMGAQGTLGSTASNLLLGAGQPAISNVFSFITTQSFNSGYTALTWNPAPSNGATSGTLSAPFPSTIAQSTGTATSTIRLSNGQIITASFTVGSTTVNSFSAAVSGTVTTSFGISANYGSYAYNNSSILGFSGNYSLIAGAFGQCWYSYQYNLMMDMMYNGASAFVANIGEPLSGNIPAGTEVSHLAINQRLPLALAAFYAPGVAAGGLLGSTVFGDPLYQPYKNTTFPNDWNGRGVLKGLSIGVS